MMSVADASSGSLFHRFASLIPARGTRLTLSPALAFAVGAVFVLAIVWAAAATYVLLFRDDLIARVAARQSEMQFAYEDRLGAMRAQVERVASKQLLEQDGVEGRVAELLSRQAQLETRQAIVLNLAEQPVFATATSAGRPREPAPAAPKLPQAVSSFAPVEAKPSPVPDNPLAGRAGAPAPASPPQGAMPNPATPQVQSFLRRDGSLDEKLGSADRSIRAVAMAQMKTLDGLAQTAERRLTGLRGVIAEVGLNPDQAGPSAPRPNTGTAAGAPMGGPLVPLKFDAQAGPFERVVDRLQTVVVAADRLRRTVAALPLGRPMPWDPDVTSGFGVRLDPFTRGYAMHTGIDFRAESGAPVRATAGGRVVGAEYSGGYGNMVEIEHGNGLTTRYAHLSAIAVTEGQTVEAGSVIGRVGSTGRSTGAHLHYETRLSGDPVDPQRFLKAGARLRAQL